MNVTFNNIDKVRGELTVSIVKDDYQAGVEKSLKTLRKNVQMPGFRKGMVPMGMIKKMYGTNVVADEINKILGEAIYNYVHDNEINMLGEPLPKENKEVDFENNEDFEFVVEIALAPEFDVEVSKEDKLPFYTIEVSDEMIDQQVQAYTQQTGKHVKVDEYADNDMIKGLVAELDENGNVKEGGKQIESQVMMPRFFKNEDEKKKFEGAKVNDVITFNPYAAWEGNDAELSSLLKIEKEEVENYKNNFTFQVEELPI